MAEFINKDTGEIVKIASYRTEEQEQAYRLKSKQVESRKKAHAFTFSNMQGAEEVIKMLTPMELGYFLVLQTYIDYENNALIVSTHNPVPMNRGQIGEVLGLNNRSSLKKNLDNFIEKGLIIEQELVYSGKQYKAYCINEQYHFKGRTKSKKVVKTFSAQVRKIYNTNLSKKGNKQPSELGFMYLILPYIHYELNILCANPFETDVEAIQPLSITDICEVTGMDRKNIQGKLHNLKWDNMTVFAKVVKGNKVFLKVNPFVFYRKDGEPAKSLKADFLIKGR